MQQAYTSSPHWALWSSRVPLSAEMWRRYWLKSSKEDESEVEVFKGKKMDL